MGNSRLRISIPIAIPIPIPMPIPVLADASAPLELTFLKQSQRSYVTCPVVDGRYYYRDDGHLYCINLRK
jgi:hypothetical protein